MRPPSTKAVIGSLLPAYLRVVRRFPSASQTQLVCLAFTALVLAAVVAVILAGGGGGAGPRRAARSKTDPAGYISGGLDRPAIEALAQARKLDEVYWLGPASNGAKIVTDTHKQVDRIQLAYLNRSAQRAVAAGHVAFSILVITQPLGSNAEVAKLREVAGKTVRGHGFTAYLPPKKYMGQHRFFLVSDDRRWGGVVDYGARSTMARVMSIARRVQLLDVPAKVQLPQNR